MSDRVSFTIDDVVFKLAPMNLIQKQEIADCMTTTSGNDRLALMMSQALYLKYSLKEISGVVGYDDKPYELKFEGDYLTDDCVSEILNLEQREKLTLSAWSILNGIDEKNKIEGVKLEVIAGGK